MTTTRRTALVGLGGALGVAACGPDRVPGPAPAADVVAAGQPAALLIWAVARDRLAGWPRKPAPDMLTALPARAAALPELGGLSGIGRQANLEAVAALRPSLIIDYGDTDPENRAVGERMQARLGGEWRLIDGALEKIPEALREAGRLLDAVETGDALAGRADAILDSWRRSPPGPAFYYARGGDGLETGFRGALATEVLEGAGWRNVAEGSKDIGRVTLEQVNAWDPGVIVTLDPGFARAAYESYAWRKRRDGSFRRILLVPDLPFGWIDRPPSVNRLLGCAWLAEPQGGSVALAVLSRRLYGMAPAEIVGPRWLG
ncbi:iron ABC transporter substrate-binding protein [Brevundimonas lenta]|uniref:Iron complex transport system substrate-binding protein n=1 Tax=Brevundimonas lenta TaxID=424796 RepID=A0A7W6JBE4_9CAUL|nr:iron ABC transporter substrate-binding protein [Brevundimonas lenta]MBB4082011.1 iron complex transport system substrate-binding protein [Brevundimonas lenta]